MALHVEDEGHKSEVTLRQFGLPDWRWQMPEGEKLRIGKGRVQAGIPMEMRHAFEENKRMTGLSFSEQIRRMFNATVLQSVVTKPIRGGAAKAAPAAPKVATPKAAPAKAAKSAGSQF